MAEKILFAINKDNTPWDDPEFKVVEDEGEVKVKLNGEEVAPVEVNPTSIPEDAPELEAIKIGENYFKAPVGGGTSVEGNPTSLPQDAPELEAIKIGENYFKAPSGGGGEDLYQHNVALYTPVSLGGYVGFCAFLSYCSSDPTKLTKENFKGILTQYFTPIDGFDSEEGHNTGYFNVSGYAFALKQEDMEYFSFENGDVYYLGGRTPFHFITIISTIPEGSEEQMCAIGARTLHADNQTSDIANIKVPGFMQGGEAAIAFDEFSPENMKIQDTVIKL